MGEKNEFKRNLTLPQKSFFLFGPRGTGKSTLIRKTVPFKLEINLLKSSEFIPLSQNPSLLEERTGHLKRGDWVFIDEVQKIPAILDEVHALYEEKGLHFALSGSSARKLKRGAANLLAGRALQVFLYPLTFKEYGTYANLNEVLDFGTLPLILTDPVNRVETLSSYVETYLKQELIEEGLIRKLEPFIRFLKVAGLFNAQVLNVENIARESHIKRNTVDQYFEILEDTLIAYRLPAIKLGIQERETTHPKLYFFDSGIARASAGLLNEEADSVSRGFAFETQILQELRAYNHYQKKNRNFYYYKVSNGPEIDLLVELNPKTMSRAARYLAIEIKLSKKWDSRWSRQLNELKEKKGSKIESCIGIYQGKEILTQDGVTIYPFYSFLELLEQGKFF